MARMTETFRDGAEDRLSSPAVLRCLRTAANQDHKLASAMHNRGKNARTRSMARRLSHLCVMSARYEAQAADLAMEVR